MNENLQVQFIHVDPSPAVAARIGRELQKLRRHHPGIGACHVTVTAPERHRRHGGYFHVRIEIRLPGNDLIVNHAPLSCPAMREPHASGGDHDNVYVTVRDAFASARRQLDETYRKNRARVRHGAGSPASLSP